MTVRNLRGIHGQVDVDFRNTRDGICESLVVVGDNGSGKSSLIDAIEFGLRGRLSRRGQGGQKSRREVKNLLAVGPPGVLIHLNDGRLIHRGGGLAAQGANTYQGAQMVEDFAVSPIVVRRQHIETFWTMSESQRKEFFYDYLKLDFAGAVSDERFMHVEMELADRQQELNEARVELAEWSGVKTSEIPEKVSALDGWKRSRVEQILASKKSRDDDIEKERKFERRFRRVRAKTIQRNSIRGNYRDLSNARSVEHPDITNLLESVSVRISEDFRAIAPINWIARVDVLTEGDDQLKIGLRTTTGVVIDPVQVLSEASLDLLALLVILEVHIECAQLGQSKVIVLDDVFQSVDSVLRIRALDHIFQRLRTWQLVICLHDRLWLDLTAKALNRNGVRAHALEVVSLGSAQPPVLRSARSNSDQDLRSQLDNFEASATICATAGRLLEEMCSDMSSRLEVKVVRKAGDKHTLGDLWPGVQKILKSKGGDAVAQTTARVSQFIDLRNLVGAHYNEWADSLANAEARDFGESVHALWVATRCDACGSVFSKFKAASGNDEWFGWKCGLVHDEVQV